MRGKDKVVVVGMGTVNPLGIGTETFWSKLIAGEKSAGPIRSFDASGYRTQCGHEIPDSFDPLDYMDAKTAQRQPRAIQYLIAATTEAVVQAFGKYQIPRVIHPCNRGIYIGTCISHIPAVAKAAEAFYEGKSARMHPTLTPRSLLSFHSGQLAIHLNLQGPTGAIDTACASGVDSIRLACLSLLAEEADLILAAGVDVFSELLLATFDRAGGLSRRNHDPGCRPFDRWRDGFLPGEGASVLALMRRSQAERFGIIPLATIAGWATSNDAYSWVAPNPEGTAATRTMFQAIVRAGISPRAVGYINAHGTGTPLNDPAETTAIKTVFGDRIDNVAVGSTKGSTGHLLGGAGVLEALICVMAVRTKVIPPTVGLRQRDLKGECDLDYVRQATKKEVKVALTNSFGFGGHNGSIVLAEA